MGHLSLGQHEHVGQAFQPDGNVSRAAVRLESLTYDRADFSCSASHELPGSSSFSSTSNAVQLTPSALAKRLTVSQLGSRRPCSRLQMESKESPAASASLSRDRPAF